MAINGTNGNGIAKVKGPAPVTFEQVEKLGMAAYRAPSLSQPHRAREAFADAHNGKIAPLIAFFCGLSSPPVVKMVAQFGYDVVFLDWEHAATNNETMTQMVHDIQYFSEGKSMAVVRVPGHGHDVIGAALDAGASIMVPQVDTVEQAQHVVSAAKFGAKIKGQRSAPPCRWLPGIADGLVDPALSFHENLNHQAAVIIQIESMEGIRNLDAILTACGDQIDSVWLGSLDARISMGLPSFWGEEPEWLAAVAIYESALAKHNMPASGMAFGPPEVKAKVARGRSVIAVAADLFALMATIGDYHEAKAVFPRMDQKGVYKQL